MIHSLWILNNNGICIFQLNCGCFEIDPQLFSGLLSALSSFTRETIKREINTILIEDVKFIFEKSNNLYFVLCADKKDNNILLHKRLIRVQIHFLNKYKDVLSNWNGEVSKFEPFGEKVDKIVSCSMEGTELYCENCERLIPSNFITKNIDLHDFYFCCETCQEQFERLYSKFIQHGTHFELT